MDDPLFRDVLRFCKGREVVSFAFLQHMFDIGHARAHKIFDVLVEKGILENVVNEDDTVKGKVNNKILAEYLLN